MEEQFKNLHTFVTGTKNKLENEMENMLKGMKTGGKGNKKSECYTASRSHMKSCYGGTTTT